MSDATVKNTEYLLAAILSIYPILQLFFEKKRKWFYKLIIFLGLCIFWDITIKYKNIIDKENETASRKENISDSLIKELKIKNDLLSKKLDSSNLLLNQIKNKNTIQKNDFNTKIDKASEVHIGPSK